MTVEELIEKLRACRPKSEVKFKKLECECTGAKSAFVVVHRVDQETPYNMKPEVRLS